MEDLRHEALELSSVMKKLSWSRKWTESVFYISKKKINTELQRERRLQENTAAGYIYR